MAAKILEIKNLQKKYNDNFRLNIDYLFLEEGKILVIIGPNGAGKSTLIRLINLLEKPDKGNIIFDGKIIYGNCVKKGIDEVRIRKEMAVVFQESLLFNTSVYNNILLGLKIRRKEILKLKDKVYYLAKKLKISNLLYRSVKELSGGEKQRVSLARALVLEPKLLLLDEPLANIDQSSRDKLRMELFELIKNKNISCIYVTHDRNEAMMLADDIAVLNKGKIEQFGKKDEIFRKPKNKFVAGFVGVETLIDGMVRECSRNVCSVSLGENINYNGKEIFVAGKSNKGEKVMLSIRPEDVVLYDLENKDEFFSTSINLTKSTSAMNLFSGKISEIKDIGIFKKVEIDCGFNLISFVTQNSIERLGLKLGKKVIASVKASSIHLFER